MKRRSQISGYKFQSWVNVFPASHVVLYHAPTHLVWCQTWKNYQSFNTCFRHIIVCSPCQRSLHHFQIFAQYFIMGMRLRTCPIAEAPMTPSLTNDVWCAETPPPLLCTHPTILLLFSWAIVRSSLSQIYSQSQASSHSTVHRRNHKDSLCQMWF